VWIHNDLDEHNLD
jgi:hypothetical protein